MDSDSRRGKTNVSKEEAKIGGNKYFAGKDVDAKLKKKKSCQMQTAYHKHSSHRETECVIQMQRQTIEINLLIVRLSAQNNTRKEMNEMLICHQVSNAVHSSEIEEDLIEVKIESKTIEPEPEY